MVRIPENFIQDLLSRVDIVEIIDSRVPLKKAGNNFVACCPFHQEKTPSFSVNQIKQFYHCFGCGVSGDAIQFLIEREGLNFVEAIETLAGHVGMQMPKDNTNDSASENLIYNILTEAMRFFEVELRRHPLATNAVSYLKDRGLTGITAKEYRLGFSPPGWTNLLSQIAKDQKSRENGLKAGLFINREDGSAYDRFRNRIIFPIRNAQGKPVGFGGRVIDGKEQPKYLNSPETIVFNKSYELYGLYEARSEIRKTNQVIVVEGYMDVLALAQAGIKNVVATLGTACTEQHLKRLFKASREIVFCFDGDEAGRKAAWRALELCLPLLDDDHLVKFLVLKQGYDPDSFLQQKGVDEFQIELGHALSLADYFFTSLSEGRMVEHIDDRVQVANTASKYLKQIPDGLFKDMMFSRLAQLVSVDLAALTSKPVVSSAKVISTKQVKHVQPISPAIRALALLVANRDLVELTPDLSGIQEVDILGSKLFCAVVAILKNDANLDDEQIKHKLPGQIAKNFVASELRAYARIVPVNGLLQEYLGALERLQQRQKELMMEKLLVKAQQNSLSQEDKQLLQNLLLEKEKQ